MLDARQPDRAVQEEELMECTFKPRTGRMPAFIQTICATPADALSIHPATQKRLGGLATM